MYYKLRILSFKYFILKVCGRYTINHKLIQILLSLFKFKNFLYLNWISNQKNMISKSCTSLKMYFYAITLLLFINGKLLLRKLYYLVRNYG